ncbi:unnamed protein product [marine sediment metagenome]|uniref:Uncharacterized protein n=1 Tax=marine sediment metagenome TaxID=412755 RepID=X1KFX8_9ZZZZ
MKHKLPQPCPSGEAEVASMDFGKMEFLTGVPVSVSFHYLQIKFGRIYGMITVAGRADHSTIGAGKTQSLAYPGPNRMIQILHKQGS